MIAARQFITAKGSDARHEKLRLEKVYSELLNQPERDKQRLVRELLEIVENPDEEMWPRIQATVILGGRRHELGIDRSTAVGERLRNILERNFVSQKPPGEASVHYEICLGPRNLMSFFFLEALLLTLLRLNSPECFDYVERTCSIVNDVTLRNKLLRAVEQEVSSSK